MERFMLMAAALAVLAAPTFAEAKPGGGPDGNGPPGQLKKEYGNLPPGQAKKLWRQGERIPEAYLGPTYYVDPVRYHLRRPPTGYVWLDVDGRAYLVRSETGLIAEVVTLLLR